LQWRSLVYSIASSSASQLSDCLAVADVSSSMGSMHADKKKVHPVSICIALTLLLGELAAPPWKGCFLTFSSTPAIRTIDTSTNLSERALTLQAADWGGSTDFAKTFDLILQTAQRERLPPSAMVKKLFVFSDMQFNQASNGQYGDTEQQNARRKFEAAGYPMPEMVYWSLAAGRGGVGEKTKPVMSGEEGVALVSGWSGSLFKYFLGQQQVDDGEEEFESSADEVSVAKEGRKGETPLETVMEVIGAKSFAGVQVVD
jgi:hypothetical protein